MLGDLNSKLEKLGCKSGLILEEILVKHEIVLLTNKEPTFFREYNKFSEILDLVIQSSRDITR